MEVSENFVKPLKLFSHYSSGHQILLVGEGDFSFSLCLAKSFGSATNLVATSLDDKDSVIRKYCEADSNLMELEKMGCVLLHGVDATKMRFHTDLKMRKFDRIIFNFPHAGFRGKEDQKFLIRLHRLLVQRFFKNARSLLRPHGEIHVSHKTGGPFRKWNLEELAAKHSLVLVKCVDFKINDYPGYKNKRGDGSRCDEPFPLGECSTFKFRIGKVHKKPIPNMKEISEAGYFLERQELKIPRINYEDPIYLSRNNSVPLGLAMSEIPGIKYENLRILARNPDLDVGYPQIEYENLRTFAGKSDMNFEYPRNHCLRPSRGFFDQVEYSQILRISDDCLMNFYDHLANPPKTIRNGYEIDEFLEKMLRVGYKRYLGEVPGRAGCDYSIYMNELLHVTILRFAWQKGLLE